MCEHACADIARAFDGCQDGDVTQVRPYRGVEAADRRVQRRRRLIDAGLDLLGGERAPTELTVRALCAHAGLAARYFYESFGDKDEFVGAVFDTVIAELAATTQAAVSAAPRGAQHRAAVGNIVGIVAADPRIGRLVFSPQLSNAAVSARRVQSRALLSGLYQRDVGSALGIGDDARMQATARFAVGGVEQTISAWLERELDLSPHELTDRLASMLDALLHHD